MPTTVLNAVLEALRIGVEFLWTTAWAIIVGLTVASLAHPADDCQRECSDDDESRRTNTV